MPSVAGSDALQPCVVRLKRSVIIVRNKRQLPAKSWSALSVAGSFFYIYTLPTTLAAENMKIFLVSKHHIADGNSENNRRIFGTHKVLYLSDQKRKCDSVVIIAADSK